MRWTLNLYPQSRQDASDPVPAPSFEIRLQTISGIFDQATDRQEILQADRLMTHLWQSISGKTTFVGQPSSRQLARCWFLTGEMKLALGDQGSAYDAAECCAGLVAQNPIRDQIAVTFLRAEAAGANWFFSKSRQDYATIIAHLEAEHLVAGDFVVGDLRSFRCYVYLRRARYHLTLGAFTAARDDMQVATDILDHALDLCGAPQPVRTAQGSAGHLPAAFIGYDERLHWLAALDESALPDSQRNWLELCMEVPAEYAAVTMWHTRLGDLAPGAIDMLASLYTLLMACGAISTRLPIWSAKTTLLYFRAAEVAIICHDVAHLRLGQQRASKHRAAHQRWLQHADQALAKVFAEHDPDDAPPDEINLRITLGRHELWLRQRHGQPSDFLGVPDLIEIGTRVKRLLHEAFAQGKTWGAARCTQLLGYIALALGDMSDAECCLHDALKLFEQAPGDIFYPRYVELQHAIACLKR